jgi:hypothetical protein
MAACVAEGRENLQPATDGHADVGYDEVDQVAVRPDPQACGHLQKTLSVCELNDVVAVPPQRICKDAAHLVIVLGKQDTERTWVGLDATGCAGSQCRGVRLGTVAEGDEPSHNLRILLHEDLVVQKPCPGVAELRDRPNSAGSVAGGRAAPCRVPLAMLLYCATRAFGLAF